MIDASAVSASAAVRSPKTAELVAGTLRRMVVDGQLKDGDFLPNEAELMGNFGVSRPRWGSQRRLRAGAFLPNEAEWVAHCGATRPTLREAVRVLESERLVEV